MSEIVILGLAAVAGLGLGVFGHSALVSSLIAKLPSAAQAEIAILQADVKNLKAKAGL